MFVFFKNGTGSMPPFPSSHSHQTGLKMIPPSNLLAAAFADDVLIGILLARGELNITEIDIVINAGRHDGCRDRCRFRLRG